MGKLGRWRTNASVESTALHKVCQRLISAITEATARRCGQVGGIKPVSRGCRADNHSRGHRTVGRENTDKRVPTWARRDKPRRSSERNIKEARRPRDNICTLATAGTLVSMLRNGPLQKPRQRAKGDTEQGHPWSRSKSDICRSPKAQATQSDRGDHIGNQRGRHNPGISKGDAPLDGELLRALDIEYGAIRHGVLRVHQMTPVDDSKEQLTGTPARGDMSSPPSRLVEVEKLALRGRQKGT